MAQLAAAGVDPAMLQGLSMQPAQLISDPSGVTTSVGISSGTRLNPTTSCPAPFMGNLLLFTACSLALACFDEWW